MLFTLRSFPFVPVSRHFYFHARHARVPASSSSGTLVCLARPLNLQSVRTTKADWIFHGSRYFSNISISCNRERSNRSLSLFLSLSLSYKRPNSNALKSKRNVSRHSRSALSYPTTYLGLARLSNVSFRFTPIFYFPFVYRFFPFRFFSLRSIFITFGKVLRSATVLFSLCRSSSTPCSPFYCMPAAVSSS